MSQDLTCIPARTGAAPLRAQSYALEEHPSFWIVDKKGKAGKVAKELA